MEELTPETVRRRLGYMADAVSRGVTDPYEIAAQASQWYEALFSTLTKERLERLSTPPETSDRIENGWSEYDAPPPGDSDR